MMAKNKDEELGFEPDQSEDLGFLPEEAAMQGRSDFPSNTMETLSDILVSAPQGVTTWADEAQAGIAAGAKKLGSSDPYMKLYEEEIAPIRERLALARERSPVASFASEAGTGLGTMFLPGAGAGKLVGAGGKVLRGAFEGLGTAEDKFSTEGAVQTGIGAGLGAAGSLVSGGLKKLSTANPNKIRANVLGARTSEFKEIGIKEREKIAKELKDMGLFQNSKVDFDVKAGKFVPKGKSLENLEKPATDKLLDRLNSAGGKLQEEKMKVLGKSANNLVDLEDLEDALDQVVVSYSKKATGMPERLASAQEVKTKIIDDILQDLEEEGAEGVTVGMLERAKMRLGEDVGNYGKNPLLQKTPDTAQIYQNMYSSLNKKLRALVGNPKYADYNDMQQKMLTAKADLSKAIATDDAAKAQAGWGGWFNKIANETLGSPEAGLGMANIAEVAGKPGIKQAITAGRVGMEEAPFSMLRQLDPSIPQTQIPFEPDQNQPSGPGYNFSTAKPAFRGQPSPVGRTINSMGSDELTPMQIAKMRLPRTTKGLLENKDLVLQKLTLSGASDEIVDSVAQALNDDPEAVESIGAMVTMQFPTLFAKSKYGMFDGKILDPSERAKAADDTSKRTDIGSVQRAKIISELNKSGKYIGE